MVPWKIIHSAASLLSFMSGLGIFLAPIAAILGADYWIVKNKHIDVPALYRAHGRYRYNKAGTNWRAAIAFLVSVVPNIPGMAASVNTTLLGSIGGSDKIYDMFYLWGFFSAFVIYSVLSKVFPAKETLIPETIHEDVEIISGVAYKNDGVHTPQEIDGDAIEKGLGSDGVKSVANSI